MLRCIFKDYLEMYIYESQLAGIFNTNWTVYSVERMGIFLMLTTLFDDTNLVIPLFWMILCKYKYIIYIKLSFAYTLPACISVIAVKSSLSPCSKIKVY